MTYPKLLPTLLALCAALVLAGCSQEPEPADADDVQREARELAETLRSYSAEQKDQALEDAERALSELNAEVERLQGRMEERWSELDREARQRLEENLDQLEEEQALLAERYEALIGASGDAWARVREGFMAAYQDLRDAWRETERELAE
jgi:TolA-binding protein